VYGAYFSKLNYRWSRDVRNRTSLGKHPVSEVVLITLITALLSFLNPYTRMGGTELVYNLFAECHPDNSHGGLCVARPEHIAPVIRSIAVALLVKGGLTIVTFGIKLPAGIFVPTLGVGACAGRILGLCVQWLSLTSPNLGIFDGCGRKNAQCVVPGVYAMVGAAATLSGVTVRCLLLVPDHSR
jgi:chloride channel 3/4/5